MEKDSQNINVTSYNQSGGITAHTVNNYNNAPQQRKLDNPTRTQILQNIPLKDSPISITSLMGDSEAFVFANEILHWMKSQGYSNVNGVNQGIFLQPVFDLYLNINEGKFSFVVGTYKFIH